MKRSPRGPVALTLILALTPLFAACNDNVDPSKRALQSAGGLSESREPRGLLGETPAPTGRVEADHRLEQGWQKNARVGEKMPTYGDHTAYLPTHAECCCGEARLQQPTRVRSESSVTHRNGIPTAYETC